MPATNRGSVRGRVRRRTTRSRVSLLTGRIAVAIDVHVGHPVHCALQAADGRLVHGDGVGIGLRDVEIEILGQLHQAVVRGDAEELIDQRASRRRRVRWQSIDAARDIGYEVIRLDTGDRQPAALRVFRATGYREIGDYNGNPVAAFWFEKSLA